MTQGRSTFENVLLSVAPGLTASASPEELVRKDTSPPSPQTSGHQQLLPVQVLHLSSSHPDCFLEMCCLGTTSHRNLGMGRRCAFQKLWHSPAIVSPSFTLPQFVQKSVSSVFYVPSAVLGARRATDRYACPQGAYPPMDTEAKHR